MLYLLQTYSVELCTSDEIFSVVVMHASEETLKKMEEFKANFHHNENDDDPLKAS